MDDVQKAEMSGGASKGIVIASFLIGYIGIWLTNDTLTTFAFIVGGFISSVIVMVVMFLFYGMVLASDEKRRNAERTAQAATEYLRDRQQS